ncbi:hypothetical protein DFJ74DRAFT_701659 [Hyaloraphidium curvatum]|nr:hypothetical protein DFJ74DRAFT_701659 [Hyaloraphidium curvatum]
MDVLAFPTALPPDDAPAKAALDVLAAYQHAFSTRDKALYAKTALFPQYAPGYADGPVLSADDKAFDAFIAKMTAAGWSHTPMQGKIIAAGRNAVALDSDFQRITTLGDKFFDGRGLYVIARRAAPLSDADVAAVPLQFRDSLKNWGMVFRGTTDEGKVSGVPYPDGSELFAKAAASDPKDRIKIPAATADEPALSTRKYEDCKIQPMMGCVGAFILERRGGALPLWYSPAVGAPRIVETEAEVGQPLVDVDDVGLRARILFAGEPYTFLDVLVLHYGKQSLLALKADEDPGPAEEGAPQRTERAVVVVERSPDGDDAEWPWKVKGLIAID